MWAIAAAALVIKLVVISQLHGHPLLRPSGALDDAAYFDLARRVAAGDWALGPGAYYVSPLYIYFLAVVFRLFGEAALPAQIVQGLLGAAAVVLVARCAARLFSARAGMAAAALAALTGVLTFNEVLVLQSALDPLLASLALERLSAALERPSVARFLAAGVAFGVLGLNRPNALVAAALVVVVALASSRTRRSAGYALVLSAGVAFALAPVALRNRLVTGEWLLVSSHGGLNFYIGNNPQADGAYQIPAGVTPSIQGQARDTRRIAEEAAGRPLTDAEVSDHYYSQAWRWISAQPGTALRLFLRKLALVFHAAELPLNYSYAYWSRDEPTVLRALIIGPWLLVPLGIAGLFVPRSSGRRAFLVWAAFIPAYAAAVAVFFVASRYRLPLVVALCVTAAGGIEWARSALATRRWPSLRRAVIAGAVATVLAHWPWGLDEGVADERAERALHLIADGRHEEARALLDRTVPLHRDPGLLHFRAGRAWLDAGQPEAAVGHFERALAAAPGQGEVHLVMGQALLKLRRPADAVDHLERARAAGVFPDVSGLELARALVALGRRHEAQLVLSVTSVLDDTDAPTAAALGALAVDLQDGVSALRFLEEAVRRQPGMSEAHEHLGLALAQLGRMPDAVASLETACGLAPSDATAHFNLALLHARSGRTADARRYAQRAVDLDPASAEARALLADLSPP